MVAHGNVLLQDVETRVEADKVDVFYKKKVGTFYQASIQYGQIVFEGDVIRQVGPDSYEVIHAMYSTCVGCPKLWSLTGEEVTAQIGGYARIKNLQFKVRDVPLAWFPVFWIPLKTKRQSGLLTPSIRQNPRLGLAFELDYFWAISRDQDMTFFTKIYERKGIKEIVEYRRVFDNESWAYFKGGVMTDPVFGIENRGFFSYSHHYQISPQWVQRVSLGYMSDLMYNRDFPEDFPMGTTSGHLGSGTSIFEVGRPSLENFVSLTRNTSTQSMNFEGIFHVNLLQDGINIKNSRAVHRLPEIHYSIVEQELGESGVMWSLNTRYTRLARRGLGYDDICDNISCLDGKTIKWQGIDFEDPSLNLVERRVDSKRDGHFDSSKDLIRAGQRWIIQPTLNYPIFLWEDKLKIVPSATYSHMFYHFKPSSSDPSYQKNATQSYLETEVEIRTQLSRTFGGSHSSYKHEIEPIFSYIHTPFVDKSSHNFFGDSRMVLEETNILTDFDFLGEEGVQFDYYDRIFMRHLVKIGLMNRWVQRKLNLGQPTYLNIAYLKIQQAYDLSGTSYPWRPIESWLGLQLKNMEFYAMSYYFHYLKVFRTSLRLRLKNQKKHFLELYYLFDPKVERNNKYSFNHRNEVGNIVLGFESKYFTLAGGLNYSLKEDQIQFWNLKAIFKLPGECLSLRILLNQLPGTDEIRSAYSLLFDFN